MGFYIKKLLIGQFHHKLFTQTNQSFFTKFRRQIIKKMHFIITLCQLLLLLCVGVILNGNIANAMGIAADDQKNEQNIPINQNEIENLYVKNNSASISDNKKEPTKNEKINAINRGKRAIIESQEDSLTSKSSETSNRSKQIVKHKGRKNLNGSGGKNGGGVQKVQKFGFMGRIGVVLVFTLTILSFFQPVFLVFKPVRQQVEYNVPFYGANQNFPSPTEYSQADLKSLGLKLECTPTGSNRKVKERFVWNCATTVELDMENEYKIVASMENDPEKLIELDDFNLDSCQRDINLQNAVYGKETKKSCHKMMKIPKNISEELEKDNGNELGGTRRKLLQSGEFFISLFIWWNRGGNNGVTNYNNDDILSRYADYGVEFNKFSISNGKIHYPVLEKSIKYAEEKKLNPCDNFYSYVCEGFEKDLEKSMKKLNRTFDPNSDVHDYILVDQIEQFWLSHFTKSELRNKFPKNDASKNMLKFFDKCVTHKSENDEFKDLLVNQFKMNYLEVTNSTPEILEFNTEWITRIHPFNPFFSIERIAAKKTDPKTGKMFEGHEYRLQFLDSVMDPDSVKLYQDSMKETGITGRKAGLSKEENKEIQKKLLEIAQEITDIRMNLQIDGIDNKNAYKTTLGEYGKIFGMEDKIDWVKIMQEIYPDANATEADSLILYYPNSFIKYSNALAKYSSKSASKIEKQAMSEYLLWNLIDSVKIVNLDSFSPMQCIKGSYDYFSHPMSEFVFMETKINEHQRKGAKEIYEIVRDHGYKNLFQNSRWIKSKHAEYANEKMGHITTTIGLESEIPEKKAIIKKMYKTYNLSEEMNWLQMLVQVRQAKKQIFPTRELEYTDSSDFWNLWNQINIGGGNLLLPVYNNKFPAAYNFGYFGTLFGHEQAHSLQPLNEEYDRLENGTFGPKFWNKPYSEQYKRREKCFVKQYKKLHEEYYPKFPIPDTVIEDTADEVGTQAMWKAWEYYKAHYPEEEKLSFDGALAKFKPDQLIFIAKAFPFCVSRRDDPRWNPINKTFSHSPVQMRVNLPLMNLWQFSEAFQCQKGDRMNPPPEEQCHLYN